MTEETLEQVAAADELAETMAEIPYPDELINEFCMGAYGGDVDSWGEEDLGFRIQFAADVVGYLSDPGNLAAVKAAGDPGPQGAAWADTRNA